MNKTRRRRGRSRGWLPIPALALLLAATASGDELEATLKQPLRESSHAVDVRIKDGVATYVVRRSFANAGIRHDEASLGIELPPGAAATGLRIRSGRRWFDGELMERERAGALYKELTGIGPHTPRDPALLQWVWANQLHLQVFPVPPAATSTVEYTLTVPTQYAQGRYLISYPAPATTANLAPVALRIFPETPRATVRVDGQLAAAAQPVILLPPAREGWIAAQKLSTSASHVVSTIVLEGAGRASAVDVELDIRHSYRGDLSVRLVTPEGSWHTLHDRQGGGENDLRRKVQVKLPRPQRLAGTWRLVVSDHAAADVGTLDRWALGFETGGQRLRRAATDTPRFIPDAPEGGRAGLVALEVSPPPIATVAARLGRVVAGPGKEIVRLEVDAAPRLRPMPRAPVVVFVVDASWSIGEQGIEGQLQLVRAFLSHVPDARCELVLYRRRASRLFGRLVAPAELPALLDAARAAGTLAPGNGSALDEGVRLATAVLREPAAARPRYVVMTTDALLRARFRNALALRELARAPASTVSHVAVLRARHGALDEERDDSHPLSPVAAARGGVLLTIDGLPTRTPKALDAIALGLVRPTRIDGFQVRGIASRTFAELPKRLDEGAGVREMAVLASAPRQVVLTGKIWAEPFRRAVTATETFSRVSAALIFSHDLHGGLSKREMLRVAFFGRAVSPVTSYLAIEPGVRPSSAGIERGGGHGSSSGYGSAHAGIGLSPVRPDLKKLLLPGARTCARSHRPGAPWSITLDVETTFDEVVDVAMAGARDAFSTCVEEAAWRLRLPPAFRSYARVAFNLTLP
jgi:subtilisin-like proprotein convertase family protein